MAIKILSVDDELDLEILLTQYFRRKIKKGEYEFHFAHNGLEALQMLLAMPDFDVILSDINMPEMDGLTLLTKINEMRNPALKCIMVSAYGDMENIRSAMNQGAFDFTTKPINLEDLERTIEKAAEQIAFIKQAQREHTQLESIQNDLHVAQEIQQTILPKTFPPFPELKSFDLYAYMNAAKYVGGYQPDCDTCHRTDRKLSFHVYATFQQHSLPRKRKRHVRDRILRYPEYPYRYRHLQQCWSQPAYPDEKRRFRFQSTVHRRHDIGGDQRCQLPRKGTEDVTRRQSLSLYRRGNRSDEYEA